MAYNQSNQSILAIQKKECNKIIKKVRAGNLKSSKEPLYTSCMRVFTKDIYKIYGGDLEQQQQQQLPLLPQQQQQPLNTNNSQFDKYILINRIKNYHALRINLLLLKEDECLENKTYADGSKGYTIRNIINLEKRIGSKSRYGSIYLTSINGVPNTLPIATKIMIHNTNNIIETDIMNMIKNHIILKSLSRHFLLTYGNCVCSKKIAKKLKLININELADGDLKMLIEMKDVVGNSELMFNLFIQVFISIATFQNFVGYVHRDTHYGNFLYQNNNEIGYYHYIYDQKDYYLKSCKYNIMIYDFGFAKKINILEDAQAIIKKKDEIYDDYKKITNAFITKKKGGWIKLSNIPSYKDINNQMIEISNMLDKYIEYELTYNNNHTSSSFSHVLFNNIIDNIFMKYAPKSMFVHERPPNVINETPFRIN
jgi:hypothetical protein